MAWNVGVGLQFFSKLQIGASYAFGLSNAITSKVGITSNVAWLLGVGVSYNYNDKDKVSNYATDILTGTATEESMFNFVLETGFVFRVSRLLLSVRCQYMMPRSVIVPLVGIGLAW